MKVNPEVKRYLQEIGAKGGSAKGPAKGKRLRKMWEDIRAGKAKHPRWG